MSHPGAGEPIHELVDRLQREVTELRASRRRLTEAADADRRAIERALHDGVQQHLVALAAELRRLAKAVDGESPAAGAQVEALAANVREAMDEATDLAQRIYPPLLEAQGLGIALRSAAERAGVTLLVDVPLSTGHPDEINGAVYWSCVEALSSAQRGSQARIVVGNANGAVAFEVSIAGRLTDGALNRMRDRVEALGGGITVEPSNEGGSRVQGWLPTSG